MMEDNMPGNKNSGAGWQGKPLYWCCLKNEVTEDLCHKNEYLRGILGSQDLVARVTPEGLFTYANDAYCETFGKRQEELLGKTYIPLVHPDDVDDTMAEMKKLSVPPYRAYMEQRAMTVRGYRWISWHGYAIRDEMGKIVEVQAIGRDITDRVEAEKELAKQRDRLLQAQQIARMGNWEKDLVTNKFYWADEIYRIFDVELQSFKPDEESIQRFVHPDDMEILRDAVVSYKNCQTYQVEYRYISAKGREGWIQEKGAVDFNGEGVPILIYGTVQEITRRKRLEEELRRRERESATILENNPDVIGRIDKNHCFVYTNAASQRELGLSKEEIIGTTVDQWQVSDELKHNWGRAIAEVFAHGQKRTLYGEYVLEDQIKYFYALLVPEFDAGGQVETVLAISRNITEHKVMESALRESEERYRQLVENSPDAIIVHCEGQIVFANSATAKILKLAGPEQLVGRRVVDYLHKDDLAEARGLLPLLLEGKKTSFKEIKILANDGSVVQVESSQIPFMYKNKPAIIAVLRDITVRKRMEEELLKASKLESISTLAGGIAHDFNNILTIILGNISLARFYADSDNSEAAINKLEEIEKASLQAKSLIQQLQTFSRGGAPLKESTSLEGLVREAATLALSGSKVRCEFSFAKGLLPVEIDRVQFMQVVNNIMINAIQAMPRGGAIFVRGENCSAGGESREDVHTGRGGYVKISFADQGMGIPQEHIPLIFDPFFTTKRNGRGLGLATVYSIVKKHSGQIHVESREGAGTTFHITVPAFYGAPSTKDGDGNRLYKGQGKILIMDDEEAVRNVAGEILRYLGYTPAYAADGQDAVLMYREALEAGDPYGAVIMDLTVPGGMGGKEAMDELKKIDPGVKAIVSSGYASDLIMANFSKYGFRGIVAKPYQIYELGRALHKVLHE
jgi:two-component system, cell cycle sensor histidine kinase and response regulator CckA